MINKYYEIQPSGIIHSAFEEPTALKQGIDFRSKLLPFALVLSLNSATAVWGIRSTLDDTPSFQQISIQSEYIAQNPYSINFDFGPISGHLEPDSTLSLIQPQSSYYPPANSGQLFL